MRQRRRRGGRTLPPAVELGFVTGALTEDGELDRGLVRLLVDMGDGAPVTLNRAINRATDLERAYRSAARLGLTHVLTDDVRERGGAEDTGLARLTALERQAARAGELAPRVIAAGGVRPQTMAALIAASGVRELHLCCPAPADGRPGPHRTEQAQVRAAVEAARALPLPD